MNLDKINSLKVNYSRRNFLKFLLVGGSVGLFAKFFGSEIIDLVSKKEDTVNTRNFDNFKIVEGDDGLKIYSKNGEELFIIDNEE